MRWLIVEDALRDRKGHWFEYLSTFVHGLKALGDDITILADRGAEPFILETLGAKPVLPDSIWHRMSDGAGALKRYARVPWHALRTWLTLRRWLGSGHPYDIIFVPTVLVHHLLGWYFLTRFTLKLSATRLLLFFPNLPIRLDADGTPRWHSSPTTRLMRWLLEKMKPDIAAGWVILGVETEEMRQALARLTGLPVLYLPHPVTPLPDENHPASTDSILFACYGPGRPEKGSDLLQQAIASHLEKFPGGPAHFAFQWMEGFKDEKGAWIDLIPSLPESDRVNVIRRFFLEGEYARHLRRTQVMLLPYRRSSYGLRVSRVVIEAMVNGIPVIATQATTLLSQAARFGAAIPCEDGSAPSLEAAIEEAVRLYPQLARDAMEKMPQARKHFSVDHFRSLLIHSKQ